MAYSPIPPNVISTANSTTSNLAGAAVFTGTSEDVSSYAAIQVSVYSSHVSATDGLSLQQSSDGTNWDITDTYTIPATTGKVISIQPAAKFYRLVYTNGATLTTSLRIQTVYHWSLSKASSQRPSDALSNENDFEQVSAFNALFNGTTWDRMRGDTTNGLDVDVTRVIPGGTATALGKAEDAAHTTGDTGVFALAVRNDNAATSVTSANADYSQLSTDITGTLFTRDSPSNTPTLSNVSGSATSVTLLAANTARRSAIFYNDSTADCYVKYGSTASSTSFTYYLPSLATLSITGDEYAGIVTGIWGSATGSMRVTEITI